MDKALFRAYVKELVKEQMEESVEKAVKKILPELLAEAVSEVKQLNTQKKITENTSKRPAPTRAQLAEMLGLERHGDTIVGTTKNLGSVMPTPPAGMDKDNPVYQAINRDYSAVMKAMKLV
jgi:hypothetical protein